MTIKIAHNLKTNIFEQQEYLNKAKYFYKNVLITPQNF